MSAETVPVSAAMRAVTVVPILAPRVKGKIFLRLRTPAPAKVQLMMWLLNYFEPL